MTLPSPPEADAAPRLRPVLLLCGLALLVGALLVAPPAGLSVTAWRCAAVAGVMALWWVGEALPLPVTALVPLIAFPALGLGEFDATLRGYAHPLVALFFGGFVMGIAIERCGLHLRLAHTLVRAVGGNARRSLGALMAATAFLSMWLNNTSTTLAMLPVAAALLPVTRAPGDATARALMLGVAYAATIGGLATLVGTAPNAMLAAYLSGAHGIEVGFAQWMVVGVPVSATLLLGAWWWLARPLGNTPLPDAAPPSATGLTPAQRRVGVVFLVLVAAWLTRPLLERALPGLNDAALAVAAAFALFVLPDGRGRALLRWDDLEDLPWGVLVLFGGGLVLGAAMESSTLAQTIGSGLDAVLSWPVLLGLAAVVATLIVLTELASNTAIAAAFLPVVGAIAHAGGADVTLYAIPAALATSCGFMMPAGTPPNAIVTAGGHVTAREMARAGLALNLLAWAVLVGLVPPLARLAGLAH